MVAGHLGNTGAPASSQRNRASPLSSASRASCRSRKELDWRGAARPSRFSCSILNTSESSSSRKFPASEFGLLQGGAAGMRVRNRARREGWGGVVGASWIPDLLGGDSSLGEARAPTEPAQALQEHPTPTPSVGPAGT